MSDFYFFGGKERLNGLFTLVLGEVRENLQSGIPQDRTGKRDPASESVTYFFLMILVPQKVIDNHGISRYNEDKIKYYERRQ